MDPDGARRLNRSSPSCLNSGAQRTDFFHGLLGLLCRLLPLLRAAFPRARFLVRLDGGFATPEVFDFLDAEPRLDYV